MSGRTLESERILLKPLSIRDLENIHTGRPDQIETIIDPAALSDAAMKAIAKKVELIRMADEENHDWYTYWLIAIKETGEGIGLIGFKGIPDESGYAEVGYGISPDYWNRGYTTEALKTLIRWAYGFPICKGITANALKTNIGSIKVLEHCNFRKIGSTEQEYSYFLALN